MNGYDLLFILQVLAIIGIFLYKFYNVLSSCEYYEYKIGIMSFVLFIIVWGVGLLILMLKPEILMYMAIMKLENMLFMLVTMFFIIETLFLIKSTITQPRTSYKPTSLGANSPPR